MHVAHRMRHRNFFGYRIQYRMRRRIQQWQRPVPKHTISYILYDVVYDIVCHVDDSVYDIVYYFIIQYCIFHIRYRMFDILCRIRYRIIKSYTIMAKNPNNTYNIVHFIRCHIRYHVLKPKSYTI